jgi:alanine transaminase
MTDGASQGAYYIINLMITSPKDAIMISVPEYPLYSSCAFMSGGQIVPFYLDEENNWQLNEKELQVAYNKAVADGLNVKAIVMINPGNPTGIILNEITTESIIRFAVDKKIVIIADEVYRENLD